MTALRIAGCIMIAAFAALSCARFFDGLRRREDALGRAARFAAFAGSEIAHYETPFPQIVRKFAASEGIAPDADGARDALCSALEDADAARLTAFFSQIGAGFADEETRLCAELAEYLSERLGEVRAQNTAKRRARAVLTLFAAATACVLAL